MGCGLVLAAGGCGIRPDSSGGAGVDGWIACAVAVLRLEGRESLLSESTRVSLETKAYDTCICLLGKHK